MKPGLKIGQTASAEFVVTPEMFAQFGGQVVHELLSTSSLVHEMEWAARQTILPYLEAHEEGIGARVDVQHLMLTPAGVTVNISACVSGIRDNKVECEVEASHFRGKIARGTVVQVIVEKSWLQRKKHEMEVVEGIIEHNGTLEHTNMDMSNRKSNH